MRVSYRGIAVLSIFIFCCSCATYKYKKQGHVTAQNYLTEIPFEYDNGFILVPVSIDGRTYKFILDTGAELNLIDPSIVNNIKLKSLKEGRISNGSDAVDKIARVEIPKMEIGGIGFYESVGMIWNVSIFSKYISCDKIHGFIGNNLMRKSTWQIDYQKQVITITDDVDRLTIAEDAKKIGMQAGKVGNVHLDLSIGGQVSGYTFDTGFNGFLQTGDTTLLPSAPTITKVGIKGANFSGAKVGRTYHRLMDSFELGDFTFGAPTYLLIKPENTPVLGNTFFENYVTTIDWQNDVLILDDNSVNTQRDPVIYEVGFFTDYEKEIITIANVHDESPLYESLTPNSRVLKINDIDLAEISRSGEFCDFWDTYWQQLSESDSIQITVDEDGKARTILSRKLRLE